MRDKWKTLGKDWYWNGSNNNSVMVKKIRNDQELWALLVGPNQDVFLRCSSREFTFDCAENHIKMMGWINEKR